jgi:hypothetical protein
LETQEESKIQILEAVQGEEIGIQMAIHMEVVREAKVEIAEALIVTTNQVDIKEEVEVRVREKEVRVKEVRVKEVRAKEVRVKEVRVKGLEATVKATMDLEDISEEEEVKIELLVKEDMVEVTAKETVIVCLLEVKMIMKGLLEQITTLALVQTIVEITVMDIMTTLMQVMDIMTTLMQVMEYMAIV